MDYPELKKKLEDKRLVKEERDMWLSIGMYVATESSFNTALSKTVTQLLDGPGNECLINPAIAKNLRQSIISWWERDKAAVKKEKPVDNHSVTDETGLSNLENRNA